jgi:hypothetical protein
MSTAPYISWIGHGAANFAPPEVFTGANFHVFAIEASMAAVQNLADALLNPAGGGQVSYKAALPVAILSFSDAAQCTSQAEPIGWLPGREAMILIPLWEFRTGDLLPSRLVFWAPYIFIDYTIGLVSGREIWGWPKVFAKIGVAADKPGGDFSCQTTIFPTLAANTQAQDVVLYSVAQTGTAAQPAQKPWGNAVEAGQAIAQGLLGGLAADVLEALSIQQQVACVALKQFRVPNAPALACYQAIVDSPIALTGFSGGGLLLDPFTVEITTCESHTIVADLLGRAPDPGSTTLPVTFAAWAAVDYSALPGDNVVVTT